jgi:hypothetical protein
MMQCKVSQCRYRYTHTTHDHFCGTCSTYGHGMIECNRDTLKNNLLKYHTDELPVELQCNIPNCPRKKYHTFGAHHCINCKRRHPESECIIQTYEYWENRMDQYNDYPNFNKEEFRTNYFGKYVVLSLGMGCLLFVKNDAGFLMGLFMHSDNWGQYGPDTDDTPIHNMFIRGFQYISYENINVGNFVSINTSVTIKCPLCRTENVRSDILEIKGSEDKCKICLESDVELYFQSCKHACCCKDCFNNL